MASRKRPRDDDYDYGYNDQYGNGRGPFGQYGGGGHHPGKKRAKTTTNYGKPIVPLKDRICPNCDFREHGCEGCPGPVDKTGHIKGCFLCDKYNHIAEQCEWWPAFIAKNGNQLIHKLVVRRNNMPPLRYTDDYRKLPGFYGSYKDYRPWTPAYALAVQTAKPYFWKGDYTRDRDPAMNRPERLSLDELRFRKEAFPVLVNYDEEHETEARTSMTQPQHPGMAMGSGMMGMPMGMGEMGQAQINRELQMKLEKLPQQLSENEMKEKKARYLSSSPEPYSRLKREQSEPRRGNYSPTPKGRASGYDDDRGPPEPKKMDIDGDEDLDGAGKRQDKEHYDQGEQYDEDLGGAGTREEVEEAEDAPLANNPLFNMASTCPHIIVYKWGEIENQPWQQMFCGVSHFHQRWPFGQGCPDCRKDKEKKPENQRRRLGAEAAQADDGFEVQKRHGFARHRDHGQL
ncbi:hypothetical protein BGZ57DRAFT_951675 [Hyaloscypha finlandica]|nr:hypothetical protein BGZ57DRAFT_951675 [Hyaloscypha finlandica]